MTDIGDRITLARKKRALSQAQLGELLDVSRGACGQWEQGQTYPNIQHMVEIAKILDVQLEWLATGRGEMDYGNAIKEPSPAYNASLPAEELMLLNYYQKMDKPQQKALIKLLQTMV